MRATSSLGSRGVVGSAMRATNSSGSRGVRRTSNFSSNGVFSSGVRRTSTPGSRSPRSSRKGPVGGGFCLGDQVVASRDLKDGSGNIAVHMGEVGTVFGPDTGENDFAIYVKVNFARSEKIACNIDEDIFMFGDVACDGYCYGDAVVSSMNYSGPAGDVHAGHVGIIIGGDHGSNVNTVETTRLNCRFPKCPGISLLMGWQITRFGESIYRSFRAGDEVIATINAGNMKAGDRCKVVGGSCRFDQTSKKLLRIALSNCEVVEVDADWQIVRPGSLIAGFNIGEKVATLVGDGKDLIAGSAGRVLGPSPDGPNFVRCSFPGFPHVTFDAAHIFPYSRLSTEEADQALDTAKEHAYPGKGASSLFSRAIAKTVSGSSFGTGTCDEGIQPHSAQAMLDAAFRIFEADVSAQREADHPNPDFVPSHAVALDDEPIDDSQFQTDPNLKSMFKDLRRPSFHRTASIGSASSADCSRSDPGRTGKRMSFDRRQYAKLVELGLVEPITSEDELAQPRNPKPRKVWSGRRSSLVLKSRCRSREFSSVHTDPEGRRIGRLRKSVEGLDGILKKRSREISPPGNSAKTTCPELPTGQFQESDKSKKGLSAEASTNATSGSETSPLSSLEGIAASQPPVRPQTISTKTSNFSLQGSVAGSTTTRSFSVTKVASNSSFKTNQQGPVAGSTPTRSLSPVKVASNSSLKANQQGAAAESGLMAKSKTDSALVVRGMGATSKASKRSGSQTVRFGSTTVEGDTPKEKVPFYLPSRSKSLPNYRDAPRSWIKDSRVKPQTEATVKTESPSLVAAVKDVPEFPEGRMCSEFGFSVEPSPKESELPSAGKLGPGGEIAKRPGQSIAVEGAGAVPVAVAANAAGTTEEKRQKGIAKLLGKVADQPDSDNNQKHDKTYEDKRETGGETEEGKRKVGDANQTAPMDKPGKKLEKVPAQPGSANNEKNDKKNEDRREAGCEKERKVGFANQTAPTDKPGKKVVGKSKLTDQKATKKKDADKNKKKKKNNDNNNARPNKVGQEKTAYCCWC